MIWEYEFVKILIFKKINSIKKTNIVLLTMSNNKLWIIDHMYESWKQKSSF